MSFARAERRRQERAAAITCMATQSGKSPRTQSSSLIRSEKEGRMTHPLKKLGKREALPPSLARLFAKAEPISPEVRPSSLARLFAKASDTDMSASTRSIGRRSR